VGIDVRIRGASGKRCLFPFRQQQIWDIFGFWRAMCVASVTDVCTPRPHARRRSQQGSNCAITRDREFQPTNPGCATSIYGRPNEAIISKPLRHRQPRKLEIAGGDVFTKSGQTTDTPKRSRKKPNPQIPTAAKTAKSSQIHIIHMGADSREIDQTV
jgi:hypothetical protein